MDHGDLDIGFDLGTSNTKSMFGAASARPYTSGFVLR